jgi:DNA-binding FrmR family transcriptional regulator
MAKNVMKKTTHEEQLTALRRIEGQVKGVQKMVEEGKYCVDIVIQLHAIVNGLYRVSEKIFAKHIEGCVRAAFEQGGEAEKQKKLNEIISVIKMLHKLD